MSACHGLVCSACGKAPIPAEPWCSCPAPLVHPAPAKVYIVEYCIPYEGCDIKGVFATRALADAFAARHRYALEVTEWTVSETAEVAT